MSDDALIDDLFALGGVGYVAVGGAPGTEPVLRLAPGVVTETTPESNRYEELLVNPTLLTLATRRGQLDCGGLDHVAVGYGDFTQLLVRTADGHVSLGVGRRADARELAARVHEVLHRHGRSTAQ